MINILDDLTKAALGVLTVEIGDIQASDLGSVHSDGMGTLAGTLNILIVNGFTSVLDDRFQIMTFGSRVDTFTSVNGTDLGGGLQLDTDYSDLDLELFVTV